jgi:hypothetical protein
VKWSEMRKKYPNKFILIGDIIEEKISETKYRIMEGKIIEVKRNECVVFLTNDSSRFHR